MENIEIKVGDFIDGKYKCGSVNGFVTKVSKNNVTIIRYQQYYANFYFLGQTTNVTRSRIYGIIEKPSIIDKP